MTTAFIISGGGDKGAFAIGALEELRARGIQPDFIAGTSTGALIAPLLAIGDLDTAVEIYTNVRKKDVLRSNWWRPWRAWSTSLYHTDPLEKMIRRVMVGHRFKQLQTIGTPVYLCTVAAQDGVVWHWSQATSEHPRVRTWQDFDEFVAAVLASTNQPVIMPPSILDNKQCFDGGVAEVAPVSIAKELGADIRYVIANSPRQVKHDPQHLRNIAAIGLWALDRMSNETLNNDIDLNEDGNQVVIRPSEPLPSSGLDFVPKDMRTMRAIGRRRAVEVLTETTGAR